IALRQGSSGGGTKDPKVESPAPDDPTKKQTTVTLHGYCTQPDKIVGGEMLYMTVEATVDDPSTANNTETIYEKFDDVIEWIAPTQQKATSISLTSEIEP